MTEASYLTYPEDYSTDELNTVINRAGNRTRRLGIDYENAFQQHALINYDDDCITEFVWQAVGNRAENNFLVSQYGQNLYFWSLEQVPVSDSLKTSSFDLGFYLSEGSTLTDLRTKPCQFACGKGFLFLVHPNLTPLIFEYDGDTDTISAQKIVIQMRDFEGLNDGLANDEEPTTLSKEHQYNLMNQGWTTPNPITPPGGITPTNQPVYTNPYTGQSGTYRRYNDSNEQIP